MVERQKLKPKQLLRITNSIRKVIQEFVNESVVKINKNYRTKVIETPPFLSGTLPTGAASFFDTFTKKPFQLYFLTTDTKRDPAKSVSQLIDLLVHEEYGHCVNHSNSVFRFGGQGLRARADAHPPHRDRSPRGSPSTGRGSSSRRRWRSRARRA